LKSSWVQSLIDIPARILTSATIAFLPVLLLLSAPAQTPPAALQPVKTIPLPGVSGRFDHLAIDLANHLLFIAATTHHSVEVIDLTTGKIAQSIAGLGKPHGLAWVASTGSLYVADGSLGELLVYKGTPLALA